MVHLGYLINISLREIHTITTNGNIIITSFI